MFDLTMRSLTPDDRTWVAQVLSSEWESSLIVSRGVLYHAERLPGLVALARGERVGLLTYSPGETSCEIVTLNALVPRKGVGRRLVAEMINVARRKGWRRLWLVTTNDNVPAQRFYEACGWELKQIHHGAVRQARELKPQIPFIGRNGIRIEDECEYQLVLD